VGAVAFTSPSAPTPQKPVLQGKGWPLPQVRMGMFRRLPYVKILT